MFGIIFYSFIIQFLGSYIINFSILDFKTILSFFIGYALIPVLEFFVKQDTLAFSCNKVIFSGYISGYKLVRKLICEFQYTYKYQHSLDPYIPIGNKKIRLLLPIKKAKSSGF